MKYPKNDLWSVRQIEYLEEALNGYENKSCIYFPSKTAHLNIPGLEKYQYVGVLHFPNQDRTIIFEQGDDYGLSEQEILSYLQKKNIKAEVHS